MVISTRQKEKSSEIEKTEITTLRAQEAAGEQTGKIGRDLKAGRAQALIGGCIKDITEVSEITEKV